MSTQGRLPPNGILQFLTAIALLASVRASSSDTCGQYTACADCTCNTFDYDISSDCASGCAWLPESGTCTSAAAAQQSQAPAYYSLWTHPDQATYEAARLQLVRLDMTTCPLEPVPSTIVAVAVCLAISAAFACVMVWQWRHEKRRAAQQAITSTATEAWLLQQVMNYVPSSESVMWSGVAEPTNKPASGWLRLAIFLPICLPVLLPAVIWLAVGLPLTILPSTEWGFAFIFPMCFCGSMGVTCMGIFTTVACVGARKPLLRTVYAVTAKHVIVLRANARDRVIDAHACAQSYAATTVHCVSKSHNSVTFSVVGTDAGPYVTTGHKSTDSAEVLRRRQRVEAGLPASLHAVSLSGLTPRDTTTVFRLIQQRSSRVDRSAVQDAQEALPPKDDTGDCGVNVMNPHHSLQTVAYMPPSYQHYMPMASSEVPVQPRP